jgi:hypothetical protein
VIPTTICTSYKNGVLEIEFEKAVKEKAIDKVVGWKCRINFERSESNVVQELMAGAEWDSTEQEDQEGDMGRQGPININGPTW